MPAHGMEWGTFAASLSSSNKTASHNLCYNFLYLRQWPSGAADDFRPLKSATTAGPGCSGKRFNDNDTVKICKPTVWLQWSHHDFWWLQAEVSARENMPKCRHVFERALMSLTRKLFLLLPSLLLFVSHSVINIISSCITGCINHSVVHKKPIVSLADTHTHVHIMNEYRLY